jgi:acyl-CoA thioester hydrolase
MPRHVYECPVRWADIDSLGHVNNVAYVDYMQEARVDMLAIHPGETGRHALGEGVVVVRHEVEFVRPLVFRFAAVRVETWVQDVRAGSFTLRYRIGDRARETGQDRGEDTVYCRAATVLAPYVFAEARPRRLSTQERATLERFRDAG